MEDVRTRKVGAITSEVRIGQPERASSNIQAFLIKKICTECKTMKLDPREIFNLCG